MLLEQWWDVLVYVQMGHTALHYAIEDENEALVDKLLKQGASVHRSTFAGACVCLCVCVSTRVIFSLRSNVGCPYNTFQPI